MDGWDSQEYLLALLSGLVKSGIAIAFQFPVLLPPLQHMAVEILECCRLIWQNLLSDLTEQPAVKTALPPAGRGTVTT